MIDLRRGSTPTVTFVTETELSDFDEIYVVIKQENNGGFTSVEKTMKKDGVILDGNRFSIKLTQEETLCFEEGKKAELQLKGKLTNGDVMTTDVTELNVRRVLMEEVI